MVQPNPESARILLVEDSATQALKLRYLFQRQGYHVEIARTATDALATLDQTLPSLILCDISMPDMDGYAFCQRVRERPHTQALPVILLTSFLDPAGAIRALQCGADNLLPRVFEETILFPIFQDILANLESRQADAKEAEAVVAGVRYELPEPSHPRTLSLLLSTYQVAVQRSEELHAAQETLDRQAEELERLRIPTTDVNSHTGPRVLLAEDSEVNQRLAVRALEKQGCSVVIAGTGQAAVKAWQENGPFDFALMDMEMPVMGGLEATREIRRLEQGTESHTLILAMTARDSPEDQADCLAAGMDICLSKPLKIDAVMAAVHRLSSLPASVDAEPAPVPIAPDVKEDALPIFDLPLGLIHVDGDTDLLRELVGLFLDEAPTLLAQAREGIAIQDAKMLERAAHSLKGSSASLGASQLNAAAAEAEAAGHAADFVQATAAGPLLDAAFATLEPVLREFIR